MSPHNVRHPGACGYFRSQFSEYLDDSLNGLEMQAIAAHFEYCPRCREEFAALRATQSSLVQLGRAVPPANLAVRLRAAIAFERDRDQMGLFASFRPHRITRLWGDAIAPVVYRAAAGMASTAVLLAAFSLLMGTLSAPSPLIADDGPVGSATSPRYLYSSVQPHQLPIQGDSTLLVQAYVNSQGHIYDYRILYGPDTPAIRTSINDRLLFSVYQPALVFGQPVRGTVLISFAGVSVHG